MAKTTDQKSTRRTQVKELPRGEKELTADEQKQVQGGADRLVGGGIRSNTGGTPPPPVCGV